MGAIKGKTRIICRTMSNLSFGRQLQRRAIDLDKIYATFSKVFFREIFLSLKKSGLQSLKLFKGLKTVICDHLIRRRFIVTNQSKH